MKHKLLLYILTFIAIFSLASCSSEETLSKEETIEILKNSKITSNVIITTRIKNNNMIDIQEDIYYEDKYFHLANSNNILNKTWYGYIDNVLYAFYYTKDSNNIENKSSSRIDVSLLDSTKNQPNYIINCLFDEKGIFSEEYSIRGIKSNNVYTIYLTSEHTNSKYTITIKDNKLDTIVYENTEFSDTQITYTYNYNVSDISLPPISDYPLKISN